MNLVTAIATLVALVFAGAVFERYRHRQANHLLFWALGAFLFGIGTLAETILSVGYSPLALKAWYLTGAMLTAPWLGQGTVALLVRKRGWATTLTTILFVLSIFAFELIRAAPITEVAYDPAIAASEQYREVLVRNGLIVFLTILLNIYGTLTLGGGAVYSAYLFWRKRILAHRVRGNVLIAAGAILPASGGVSILARVVDWHSWSLLLGVILLYVGYLQATVKPPESEKTL